MRRPDRLRFGWTGGPDTACLERGVAVPLHVFISGLRPRTRAWFGSIANPQNGHHYSAKIRLMSPDRLRLRGYFLLPMLGATRFWTRYEGPPPPADCRMGPHALG